MSGDSDYGRTVDVTCTPGYLFPDGNASLSMWCSRNGSWVPDINNKICKRKELFMMYLIFMIISYHEAVDEDEMNLCKNFHVHMYMIYNVNFVYFPCHAALDCGQPRTVMYSYQTMGKTTYLSEMKYQCRFGYWFPDHDKHKSIYCAETGQWSEVLRDCRGELAISIKVIVTEHKKI